VNKLDGFRNHGLGPDRLVLAASAKGKNLLDDVLRPLSRLHDLPDKTPCCGTLPRCLRHFAIAEHGAKDTVKFVRYAAGERSQRFEPLRLVETCLKRIPLGFVALARDSSRPGVLQGRRSRRREV
jgi:hypothetical protein